MKTQYIKKNKFGTFYYSDAEMIIPHRDDGPACEYEDGTKQWYKDGLIHREDGPAWVYPSGKRYWYLNNNEYTEKDFKAKMKKTPSYEGKVVEIDSKKYKLVSV